MLQYKHIYIKKLKLYLYLCNIYITKSLYKIFTKISCSTLHEISIYFSGSFWPWKLSYLCWKLNEIVFLRFYFFMTSWSYILSLDVPVFTWVTDNNKEEVEKNWFPQAHEITQLCFWEYWATTPVELDSLR